MIWTNEIIVIMNARMDGEIFNGVTACKKSFLNYNLWQIYILIACCTPIHSGDRRITQEAINVMHEQLLERSVSALQLSYLQDFAFKLKEFKAASHKTQNESLLVLNLLSLIIHADTSAHGNTRDTLIERIGSSR